MRFSGACINHCAKVVGVSCSKCRAGKILILSVVASLASASRAEERHSDATGGAAGVGARSFLWRPLKSWYRLIRRELLLGNLLKGPYDMPPHPHRK